MNMSSNARKGSPPRSSTTGVKTLKSTKARVFVFLTFLILTAVFSANALTANVSAANTDTATAQQSGFVASSFNSILSFFGVAEAAPTADKADAVKGCDTAPEGLVACYRGDNDTMDARGVHNGEWVGTYGYATGKVGTAAFSFDGTNAVVVPGAADMNSAAITVDGWVNLSSIEGSFGIISKGDAYSLQVRDGRAVFLSRNAEGKQEMLIANGSLGSIKANTWTHIAATHDGTIARIYVDGKEAGSGLQQGIFTEEAGLVIGNTQSKAPGFVGLADEVKLFGRALSGKEIAEIAGNRPDSTDAFQPLTISLDPVPEGAGIATVSVTRTNAGGPLGSMIVNLAATGGTATMGASCAPGIDYVFGTPFVSFGANEPPNGGGPVTKTVPFTVCQDTLAESNETFTITATLIPGPDCTPATCEDPLTNAPAPLNSSITDDDLITLGTAPTNVPEGTGASNTRSFIVSRGAPGTNPGAAYAVNFTLGGTAQSGPDDATTAQDYTVDTTTAGCTLTFAPAAGPGNRTGTITFNANSTTQTCDVRITTDPDDFVETNESVSFTVTTNPGNPATQSFNINNDDDPYISVRVDAPNVDGARRYVNEDDSGATGTLSYVFTRGLCAASDAGTPGNPGTNANQAALCLGADPAGLTAGQAVTYSFNGGTAQSGTDFTAPSGTVTFAGQTTTATVAIDPTNDTAVENDETLIVAVTNENILNTGAGYRIDAPTTGATGYINDDDQYVTVVVSPTSSLEDTGPNMVYTFQRFYGSCPAVAPPAACATSAVDGTPQANPLIVNYTTDAASTATVGVDYLIAPPSPITILANQDTTTVTVDPQADTTPENDETVILNVAPGAIAAGSPGAYVVGAPNPPGPANASATGTILNDDLQVSVQIQNPSSVNEGSSVPAGDDGGVLTFVFNRLGATANDTCVNFTVSSGGNNATLGTDYSVTFSPATAASGCTPQLQDIGGGSYVGTIRIPGGAAAGAAGIGPNGVQQNQATMVVTPTDDDVTEGDEVVFVSLQQNVGNPNLYQIVPPGNAQGTILNDDGSTVTVAGGTSAPEGTGADNPANNQYFTITRSPSVPIANDQLFFYTIGGDAEAGDYAIEQGAPAGSTACTNITNTGANAAGTGATIPAGSVSCTIRVNPVEDNAVEPNETVTLTLVAGGGVQVGGAPGNTATVTINNDDFSTVNVSAPNPNFVNEGDTGVGNTITFTFDRTSFAAPAPPNVGAAELGNLTVNFTLGAGTATCGTDYTLETAGTGFTCAGNAGTVTFTGTNTTTTLVFRTTPELVREADESIIVNVAAPSAGATNANNYVVGTTPATAYINNDDEDVIVNSVTPASPTAVAEDGIGTIVYNIQRLGDITNIVGGNSTDDAINVTYALTGTATNGTDYTIAPASPVAFGAGVTSANVTVDPTQDAIPENNETVILTVTQGPNAANGGTASVYNAGNTNGTTGAQQAASATGSGTIGNDDFYVAVQVSPSSTNEGTPAPGTPDASTLTYTFTRIGETTQDLCANFTLGGGGNPADPNTDFAAPVFQGGASGCDTFTAVFPGSSTGIIRIPGGAGNPASVQAGSVFPANVVGVQTNQRTLTISPTDDATVEDNEVIRITVDPDQYPADGLFYQVGSPSFADGTILNDDSQVVTVTGGGSGREGSTGTGTTQAAQPITFTFNRTGGNNNLPLEVNYTIAGTGTNPASADDFSNPPANFGNGVSNTVTIPANQSSVTITITPNADNTVEPDETFIVTAVGTANYTVGNAPSQTGTILNDDTTVSCSISGNTNEGTSAAPTSTAAGVITVTCTRASNGAIAGQNLNFAFTASSGDYTVSPASPLTFTGSNTTATVTFTADPDSDVEPDETVTFSYANQTQGTSTIFTTGSPLSSTFLNDDSDVNIATNPSPNAINEDAPAGNAMTFTFTRATAGGAAGQPVTVQFTVTGTACRATPCTGASADPDFDIVFPAGTTGTYNAAAGTGTIVIPASATTASLNVDPRPDTVVEPDETVIITVATGANYDPIAGTSATGIIRNDDATYTVQFIGIEDVNLGTTPPTVLGTNQLEGNPGEPGDTVARFRVFRNGENSTAGAVTIATVPGSGTATAGAPNTTCQPGEDYTSDGRVITFAAAPAGQQQASEDFLVRICRDTVFEFTETFDVQLTNPVGGAVAPNLGVISTGLATATIQDDDAAPTLTLSCTPNPVAESAGQTSCVVTLSQAIQGQNTTFTYSTANGTAIAPGDYTAVTTGTGTIASGSTTSAPFNIAIINDTLFEGDETFTVSIQGPAATANNPNPPTVAVNGGTRTITITDDEAATTFAVSDVRQIEGNDASNDPNVASTSSFNFRITRTGDAQGTETVCFRTVNGDIENPLVNPNPATAGANVGQAGNYANDYNPLNAGPSNCVVFTQGGPSVITVPVIVYGDPVFENDESFTFEILSVQRNNNTPELAGVAGSRITDRYGLGLIQNDDGAAGFSIAQTTPNPTSFTPNGNFVVEGNTNGTGGPQATTVTYTITRPVTGVASSVTVTVAGINNVAPNFNGATLGTSCGNLNSGVDVARSAASTTLNFAASDTSATFSVTVCGDTAYENNENFTVTLSNPSNGVLTANSSVTTTILNDDATPIIKVGDATVCEPNGTDTTGAVFTINREGLSFLPTVVTVNTVDGTAQDGNPSTEDTDYNQIVGQTVNIPAATPGSANAGTGIESNTVTVTVRGDNVFETDETFTVQVTDATNAFFQAAQGGDPIGGGIIQNACAGGTSDAAPTFAIDNVTRNEGNPDQGPTTEFRFRVTRTGLTALPSTFTFSTANGGGPTGSVAATGGASCGAGVDYISQTNVSSGSAGAPTNFSPSNTAGDVNFRDIIVQVCTDSLAEANEFFTVTLNSVTFGTIPAIGATGVGQINNDDGLNFTVDNVTGNEGNAGTTNFVFRVTKNGTTSLSSSVSYTLVNGTGNTGAVGGAACTAGVDFITPSAQASPLVFTDTQTFREVTVQVCGDTVPELDETFTLRLDSVLVGGQAGVGTVSNANNTGVGTIINDDGPIVIPPGIEGDVVDANGGTAGDGLVLANDVAAIRQFILGNGTPATGAPPNNQFQRADTNNNGLIDAGDVTIIRQMILGNIPNNTPATGPTGPSARPAAKAEAGDEAARPDQVLRIIRAVNTTGVAGQQVTVQFQLDSQGDEASLSFTVNFDQTKLTYVSAALGNGTPAGTNLGLNTSQVAQGRLGVLLDATNTYANGTRQILTVTFAIAANAASGTTPITFSGTPTIQSVANAQGTLLDRTFENGTVTIAPLAAGVRVSGRVTSANGQGLRNATVTMTDAAGNRRTATTGSFGIYTFEDVDAGQSYIVNVSSKRYRFNARNINVTDSLADVNFVGQE
jgi:hypothetical protein